MYSKHSTRTSVSSSTKARLNLCSFTFSDGRRCRALRLSGHPQFCHFHARREAEARAADQLGRDSSYFFSGGYLSACDLSAALGRLFAEVASGHIKPRRATTLAYLAQVLVQTLHLAQNEYIAAFDTDSWRRLINSHVRENAAYLNPQRACLAPPSPPQAPVTKPAPHSTPPESVPAPASGHGFSPATTSPDPARLQPLRDQSSRSHTTSADPPPTSPENRPAKNQSSSPAKQPEPPTNPPPSTKQESSCAYVEVGPTRLPISASVPLKWPWPPGPSPK
jgi:hypothetical protein